MEINIIFLLATLSVITNQQQQTERITWLAYEIYKDDCPLNKELWNPFQSNPQESRDTICLCEGNYKEESQHRYNHGPYHECPQPQESLTNSEIEPLLLCWSQRTYSSENRYRLMVPKDYSHIAWNYYTSGSTSWMTMHYELNTIKPLFHKKYPNAIRTGEHDPHCNLKKWQEHEQFKIKEQKREQKLQLRDVCSYRGRKHKKNHR